MRIDAVGKSICGAKRRTNQDAYVIVERLGLYGVADSVGDGRSTQTPASRALYFLESYLSKHIAGRAALDKMVKASIEHVNAALIRENTKHPRQKGVTTLTYCLASEDGCVIGHVGDSAAWHIRGEEITRITTEDTLAGLLAENRIIGREEVKTHPGRNYLINSLGDTKDIHVGVRRLTVRSGDYVVLATDGVARSLAPGAIVREVRDPRRRLSTCASRLIGASLCAGAGDDLTAVVIRFRG
ncbi:MAG TPA: serine/threonine-protein phosphatase [Candidatus Hydrogenedentes bacterium]|nr:serine/threonine-protein phosphatase [Candidatus Hydrogenedentota bacterium]